jgi:hypothetical protein
VVFDDDKTARHSLSTRCDGNTKQRRLLHCRLRLGRPGPGATRRIEWFRRKFGRHVVEQWLRQWKFARGQRGDTFQQRRKRVGLDGRPYYIGAASVNGGTGQFNIPYQFDDMAVPDNPDIKVVITDGGGNDILVNNRQCLTTSVMGDTSCHMIIDDVLSTAQKMLADMASKGVEHIVYYFYPHIDTTALFTGPDANDWLDYAYPMAAQACCAADALPAGTPDLTCHGSPAPGVDCTFIDTRPEFAGHNDPNDSSNYWFDSLGIHPNQQGADALANKVWGQMQKYCIAQ